VAGNGIVTLPTGIPVQRLHRDRYRQYRFERHLAAQLVHAATSNCGQRHLVGCIDASAFTVSDLYPITSNYAYGNAGRNLLHGPGAETVIFSYLKIFRSKERLKFQFRFETFGLFNHTNFSNPGATTRERQVPQCSGLVVWQYRQFHRQTA